MGEIQTLAELYIASSLLLIKYKMLLDISVVKMKIFDKLNYILVRVFILLIEIIVFFLSLKQVSSQFYELSSLKDRCVGSKAVLLPSGQTFL